MIKGIVFDLDNTLFDFMKYKRVSVDAAIDGMLDAGLDMSKKELLERIYRIYWQPGNGIEDPSVFDKLLNELWPQGQINYLYLAAAVVHYSRARKNCMHTYPHAHYTLTRLLKRGIPMVILSDAPKRQCWIRIYQLNLYLYFKDVICAEDVGARKPDPKMFEAAQKALNVPFHEILVIDDWEQRGIIGAKALGMQTAFAKYGDQFNTQTTSADFVLNDIRELLPIVDKSNEMPPALQTEKNNVECTENNKEN